MKKLLFIIINLIVILTIYNNICLAKTNLIIEADKYRINKDEEVSVTINIENASIAACTLEIYFDVTKLELISSPENSNYSNNRILYTWVSDTGKGQENLQIEEFTFKSITNDNGIASIIITGEIYNTNGEKSEIENSNLELQLGEENKIVVQSEIELTENTEKDNTNLQILRLNHVGISPEFSNDIKEYYIILDSRINDLEVTAIPENQNANVTITGNTNLKNGVNTVNIKVESEDKSKTDSYKIHVTKTANQETANANLETLAIRDSILSPEFNNNVTKYNVYVGSNIENIDVLAIPQKENASVSIKKTDKLQIGNNKIEITVMAEDGITKKKYEIMIHRRNTDEQIKFEEETKKQEETLNSILEDIEKEGNNSNINQEENKYKKSNIIIMSTIIILAIITIVFIIYFIQKKNKTNK